MKSFNRLFVTDQYLFHDRIDVLQFITIKGCWLIQLFGTKENYRPHSYPSAPYIRQFPFPSTWSNSLLYVYLRWSCIRKFDTNIKRNLLSWVMAWLQFQWPIRLIYVQAFTAFFSTYVYCSVFSVHWLTVEPKNTK